MEENFLQGLGFKGRGLIVVLFLMGLIMHLLNIIYPIGVALMIAAAILLNKMGSTLFLPKSRTPVVSASGGTTG